MLDNLSLDQIRTFIAAAEEGSFSAAGRRLGRAQSAVSQTVANLEAQIGVQLFDRSGRKPILSDPGRALLRQARDVAAGIDGFKARAKGLAEGLEAELSVVVDVLFPIDTLTCAVAAFQQHFPATPIRLYVEALGAVLDPVLNRQCDFGILGSLPLAPAGLTRERLLTVEVVMVAAAGHPLGRHSGPIPSATLTAHVQLVLTDRSRLSQGQDFAVFSPQVWRLADLGAKHAFLLAGLGWGGMPLGVVQADLARGTLVRLTLEDAPLSFPMPMFAVYQTQNPPGPGGRWLIDRLKPTPGSGAEPPAG
jgi:DNA-binding transcriptional LysR family regulator